MNPGLELMFLINCYLIEADDKNNKLVKLKTRFKKIMERMDLTTPKTLFMGKIVCESVRA